MHTTHDSVGGQVRGTHVIWRALRTCWVLACWVVAGVFVCGQVLAGLPEALLSPWVMVFAGALACTAASIAAMRRWGHAVCIGAVAVWALAVWLPPVLAGPAHVPAGNAPIEAGQRLRIVCANVNFATRATDDTLAWLRAQAPDILVVIECPPRWYATLSAPHGMPELPFRAGAPADNADGIAVFSRYPLPSATVATSPARGFAHIDAQVATPVGPLRLLAVHPAPPVSREYLHARNTELAWLADNVARRPGDMTVVVGDFNETPWGDAYARFAKVSGLHSARDGYGVQNTWHRALPALLRIPIDHCFISAGITSAGFAVGPENASDHLPIVVDLILPAPRPASLPE